MISVVVHKVFTITSQSLPTRAQEPMPDCLHDLVDNIIQSSEFETHNPVSRSVPTTAKPGGSPCPISRWKRIVHFVGPRDWRRRCRACRWAGSSRETVEACTPTKSAMATWLWPAILAQIFHIFQIRSTRAIPSYAPSPGAVDDKGNITSW